jgi:hypothetical protein
VNPFSIPRHECARPAGTIIRDIDRRFLVPEV